MSELEQILKNNEQWANSIREKNPTFFSDLAKAQSPEYLCIGCSDSRAPVEQIMGLQPGDIFVHRNVGNQVVPSDLNTLSVIQFAVEALKVKHIIVKGHYECGGVKASVDGTQMGMMDNWLRHIRDVYVKHEQELDNITDMHQRYNRLCELNVIEQVANVCNTSVVRQAWANGHHLQVHGLIYSLKEGSLHNLHVTADEKSAELQVKLKL